MIHRSNAPRTRQCAQCSESFELASSSSQYGKRFPVCPKCKPSRSPLVAASLALDSVKAVLTPPTRRASHPVFVYISDELEELLRSAMSRSRLTKAQLVRHALRRECARLLEEGPFVEE